MYCLSIKMSHLKNFLCVFDHFQYLLSVTKLFLNICLQHYNPLNGALWWKQQAEASSEMDVGLYMILDGEHKTKLGLGSYIIRSKSMGIIYWAILIAFGIFRMLNPILVGWASNWYLPAFFTLWQSFHSESEQTQPKH